MASISCTIHKDRLTASAETFLAFTVYQGAHFVGDGFERGMSEIWWAEITKL